MLMSPERDEGEQAEQGGGGAGDGLIGPLTWGLDAEVATDLGKGDLDAPAANEPAQDIERIGGEIGAQEGLRAELILAVAHQHVADRDAAAGMRPDGGAAGDLDLALDAAIPARDLHRVPACAAANQLLRQVRQAATDDARPANPRLARRWRLEQAGVQAQPSDDPEPVPDSVEQVDDGVAAVGNDDNAAVGQPARNLEQSLPRPSRSASCGAAGIAAHTARRARAR